jgi:hypothetical protein
MGTRLPSFHRSAGLRRTVFMLAAMLPLCATMRAGAQSTAVPIDAATTDPGWLKVETLELGRRLHVKTKAHTHVDCLFGKADAETLTCGGVVFQKAQIQSIKPSHRTRSTWVGLGVGYFAAGGVSAAAYAGKSNQLIGSNRCNSSACIITIAVVDIGLPIAMPIIFHVYDLTATAIYKAQ